MKSETSRHNLIISSLKFLLHNRLRNWKDEFPTEISFRILGMDWISGLARYSTILTSVPSSKNIKNVQIDASEVLFIYHQETVEEIKKTYLGKPQKSTFLVARPLRGEGVRP